MIKAWCVAVSLAALATTSPTLAAPRYPESVPTGRAIAPPRGFVAMCQRQQAFCAPSTLGRGSLMGTDALVIMPEGSEQDASEADHAAEEPKRQFRKGHALLRRVNEYVNRNVFQRSDQQIFGRDEYWQRSGTGAGAAGDCEDIAIEKRYELIDRGFPPEGLVFAVVYAPEAGLHTVLVARTAHGDLVLDSRTDALRSWARTHYVWIGIQSAFDPMTWYAAGPNAVG